MNIDDHFRDLAQLDPSRDPERWEAMVGSIMSAAAPELARRATFGGPALSLLLADWMRPALSFAAGLAAVAALTLALVQTPAAGTAVSTESPGIASALGVSAPVSTWVETGTASSLDELALALEEGAP